GHWERLDQPLPPLRPYQGVRVKEPVKELLKRKRGSAQNTHAAAPATTVRKAKPHDVSSSFIGQVVTDSDFITPSLPVMEETSVYSGWLTQPSPASLQPLTQWTTFPDYMSHEAVTCPYTADTYVQPMCPSYTLVGTSSVLTYASQPLITNFARPTSAPTGVPHLDVVEQQGPLNYFPWTQPISTLPTPSLQYQPTSANLPVSQFVPFPVSVPDIVPQELEDSRKEVGALTMEKFLLQEENSAAYDLTNSLPVEGL
uniref:POU class 2 homeobox associating factor 1 n=1 Tax=Salvator merianae TaxID=96440 RepID=A0A8D0E8W9_SALMN